MSASGDYDVSIVESFAPPAKWVPGQEINKDVYAVNTGNVEAYVKESISGVLTIVTEDAYKTAANKPDADSIELTPAERYVVEAGAFLAYAPATSNYTYQATDVDKVIDGVKVKAEDVGKVKSGMKAVAMSPEPRQTEYDYNATATTDFTPDAEGLYIFRRTIGVDPNTQLENYTYDAYYYVPGTGTAAKEIQSTQNGVQVYQKTGFPDVASSVDITSQGYAAKGTETKDNVPVYVDANGANPIATDDFSTLQAGYKAKTEKVQYKGTADDTGHVGEYKWVDSKDPTVFEWTAGTTAPATAPTSGGTWLPVYETTAGVDGTFYKISDLAVTPEKATFAGDLDQRDGMVATGGTYNSGAGTYVIDPTVAPKYGFYKDVTNTVVPKLTYDAAKNRLVASYDTGMNINKGDLDVLAEAYEDAAIAYQDALKEYNAALSDLQGKTSTHAAAPDIYGSENTLADETATLRDEIAKLLAAQQAEAVAKKKYEDGKKLAEQLETAMNNAKDEMDDVASDLGTEYLMNADGQYVDENGTVLQNQNEKVLAVYQPAVGGNPAKNDTLWGRYNAAKLALGETTDVYVPADNTDPQNPVAAQDDTAYGHENAAKAYLGEPGDSYVPADNTDPQNPVAAQDDTAYGRYNTAKSELDSAVPSDKDAFLDIIIAMGDTTVNGVAVPAFTGANQAEKRVDAENWINSLTYAQVDALAIDNNGTPEYNYYRKVVAEKYAKEELQRAQDAYDAAVRDRIDAQNALATALANRQAAENALGNTDPSNVDTSTAAGRYNKAKQGYEAQMIQVYGYPNGGAGDESTADYATNPTATAGKYKAGSDYADYLAAQAATAAQQAKVDTQQNVYNNALDAANVDADEVEAAANHLAETRQAMDNAKAAYDTAFAADKGELKININLADVVTEGGTADKWQILPESLEDKYVNATTLAGTDGTTDTASFYYTSILGGGETSAKLIDSVELDETVTKEMFKYFDFDLNVVLNSAQVNIDSNGNYTAETAQTELGKYAILADNTSADTAITWSDTATTAPTKYNATAKTSTNAGGSYGTDASDVTIEKLDKAVLVDGTYCIYKAELGADYYYGNSLNQDAEYKCATEASGVYTVDANKRLKLNADATVDNT